VESELPAFQQIREKLARELASYSAKSRYVPLKADRWILASAFQKAIRRGELGTAQSAAMALLDADRQMLFRRLHVLAVEDLGVGDIDLAIGILASTGEAKVRQQLGGDRHVVEFLVERLCEAALDRTADHLLSIAQGHPEMEEIRWDLGRVATSDLMDRIKNTDLPISARAVATWYAAGTNKFRSDSLWTRQGDLESVFATFCEMGIDEVLLEACQVAIRKMRNPLPLFLPLIWLEYSHSRGEGIIEIELPAARSVRNIPVYSLGGHTRLGKRALRVFLRQCDPIRQFLKPCLPDAGWQDTANVAVFHVESALVKRQRLWDGFEELRTLGIEGDVCRNGLEPEAVQDFLGVVGENMALLDDIRVELLEWLQPESDPEAEQPSE